MAEQPVTLSDGVVLLRVFEPTDAQAVFAACQDAGTARFVTIPQPYTTEHAEAFVARRRADWEGDDERSFAITDARFGELLGAIARHQRDDHRVEFGYWLTPAARGRGFATRALRLILDWSLCDPALLRFELFVHPDNQRSAAVAERVGFTREGVRRAWDLDREGRPEDAIFYVFIRGDRRDEPGVA